MKERATFKKIATFSLWILLLLPFIVLAQDEPLNCCKLSKTVTIGGDTFYAGDTVSSPGKTCTLTPGTGKTARSDNRWTLFCLVSGIIVVTDWVFAFLMTFVGLMTALGIFTLVTAAGYPEKINKGKNYILFALIGMVVGLLSKGVPDLVEAIIGI